MYPPPKIKQLSWCVYSKKNKNEIGGNQCSDP